MELDIRQITMPTEDDVARISEAAAAAFAGDNFLIVATGNDTALNVPYHRAQVIAASLVGWIFVAEDKAHENRVIGVALWFPPGVPMFGSDDQREAAFMPFLQQCPLKIQQWWTEDFLVEYPKASQNTIGTDTLHSAWHLQLLATAPEYQGKGVGSALVRHGQQKVFAEGLSVYLETQVEENVGFYQRLGFVSRGRQDFKGVDGGFPLFCMIASPLG